MTNIYFHGGPGLNAEPERNTWASLFKRRGLELALWDEPSRQRPDGPQFRDEDSFGNYLDQAEAFFLSRYSGSPTVLLGHSFGCHAVAHLAQRHAGKIARAVFISPDFSLRTTDVNMFNVGIRDFEVHGDLERGAKLRAIRDRYSGRWDENTQAGFLLLAECPRLFSYYWNNTAAMEAFLRHYSAPRYALDAEGFFKVRDSWRPLEMRECAVPATVIFGKHDIVISASAETALLRQAFRSVEIRELENSGHYPHIEEPEDFIRWVLAADSRPSACEMTGYPSSSDSNETHPRPI